MDQPSTGNLLKSKCSTRQAWLDVTRIVACIMVIMMHATVPAFGKESSNSFNAIVTYLMSPCNGLFFMVSGALLIKPQIVPFVAFLKRRICRIVPPLLSWSLIYILLRFCLGELTIADTVKSIIMLPISAQGCGYFWFMYVLIGCYIFIPIWSAWLQDASRKSVEIILLLWLTTSFIPLLLSGFPYIEEFNSWMYYFSGFMGYFILGYYVYNFSEVSSWRNIMIGGFLTVILGGLHLYVMPEMNPKGRLYCYLQPYVITSCFTIFCLIYRIFRNTASHTYLVLISEATFGIYLSQSLILNYILKESNFISQLSPVTGFFTRVFFTFIFGYILVRIISHTPLKRILTV